MLLLVSHPAIGSGLETLLRLERRFDVRWHRSTEEIDWSDWRPDIVVAEQSTLGESALPGPTVLLVGQLPAGAASGKADKQFRFLKKDSAVTDLVAVIDDMLGTGPSKGARKTRRPATLFVAGALGLALIAGVLWLTLRP